MNNLMDQIADAILWVPMVIWHCFCVLIRYALRLQTIICHSQYAVVVENGGNVAVVEQWDDVRVEIHRKNFRSGSEPASVEQFVDLFPVGKMLDANAELYKRIVRPGQIS